jgi:serine/threonine protein kinase
MSRATDLLLSKIVTRNRLAPAAAVSACLEYAETLGGTTSLGEILVERGLLSRDEAEKADHAARLLQAHRYLKIAREHGIIDAEQGQRALAEYRGGGYRNSVAHVLVRNGAITPTQNLDIVSADPMTLEDALDASASAMAGAASPGAPGTDRTQAMAPALPTGGGAAPEPPPPPAGALAPPPAQPPFAPPGQPFIPPTGGYAPPGPPPQLPPTAEDAPVPTPPGAQDPDARQAPQAAALSEVVRSLSGPAREVATVALRDGVIAVPDLAFSLSHAPPAARSDARALLDALVACQRLAHAHVETLLAYLVIEHENPSFEIDGYYLLAPLGFSATGPVLLARRTAPDGTEMNVAVEVLTPHLSADARRFERFRSRTGALSLPALPSLARTIDSGRAGDGYYIARMVYPKLTLARRLAEGRLLEEKEAVLLARDVAAALRELAAMRIVHGAVRAENIAYDEQGVAVLQDVGTTPMPAVIDPEEPPPCVDLRGFLAPEQMVGDPLDVRTDLYALGCCLFQALSGRRPFDGATAGEVMAQVLSGRLPDVREAGARVSPRLAGVIRVLMTAPPDNRYATPDELLAELDALGATEDDRTVLYEDATGGDEEEQTVIASAQDLDVAEIRRQVEERRAREAALAEGMPPLGVASGPLPPSDDPLVGRVLSGRYRLRRRIGEGGMGVVYQADHMLLQKTVAIKILHPRLLTNEESVSRFDREVRAASRFAHPNVVQIFDAGDEEGPQGRLHYMVLEFVEGRNLATVIETESELEVSRAVSLVRDALAALGEAHAQGIVHRDMKSDNVMICQDKDGRETAKVMDFGIAKMLGTGGSATGKKHHSFRTKKGVVTGTPQYMSPEQAAGEQDIDWRSDLYSLGVIFYEMVMGTLPFKSNTAMGYLGKHIVEPPMPFKAVRPDLDPPPDLERIVMKALEKRRDDRFQSADEMRAEIDRCFGEGAERTSEMADFVVEKPGLLRRLLGALFGRR